MGKPLLATKSVNFIHHVRAGTSDTSYTFQLSKVSCAEVQSAQVDTPGFSRRDATVICIFPGYSTAAPVDQLKAAMDAGRCFLPASAFKAIDPSRRSDYWTLSLADKVQLPSGRTATVTSIHDNRDGRVPHWCVEVS